MHFVDHVLEDPPVHIGQAVLVEAGCVNTPGSHLEPFGQIPRGHRMGDAHRKGPGKEIEFPAQLIGDLGLVVGSALVNVVVKHVAVRTTHAPAVPELVAVHPAAEIDEFDLAKGQLVVDDQASPETFPGLVDALVGDLVQEEAVVTLFFRKGEVFHPVGIDNINTPVALLGIGPHKNPQFVVQEAVGYGSRELVIAHGGRIAVITTLGGEIATETFPGFLQGHVHRSSQAVCLHVGRVGLGNIDSRKHVGSDHGYVGTPVIAVGGQQADAFHHDVIVLGSQSTDGDLVGLATTPVDGNTGQAADGFGSGGIGQFLDPGRGYHVLYLKGIDLGIYCTHLSARQGGDHHFFSLDGHGFQGDGNGFLRRGAEIHSLVFVADIFHQEGKGPVGYPRDLEMTGNIGGRTYVKAFNDNVGPDENLAGEFIGHRAVHPVLSKQGCAKEDYGCRQEGGPSAHR